MPVPPHDHTLALCVRAKHSPPFSGSGFGILSTPGTIRLHGLVPRQFVTGSIKCATLLPTHPPPRFSSMTHQCFQIVSLSTCPLLPFPRAHYVVSPSVLVTFLISGTKYPTPTTQSAEVYFGCVLAAGQLDPRQGIMVEGPGRGGDGEAERKRGPGRKTHPAGPHSQ